MFSRRSMNSVRLCPRLRGRRHRRRDRSLRGRSDPSPLPLSPLILVSGAYYVVFIYPATSFRVFTRCFMLLQGVCLGASYFLRCFCTLSNPLPLGPISSSFPLSLPSHPLLMTNNWFLCTCLSHSWGYKVPFICLNSILSVY